MLSVSSRVMAGALARILAPKGTPVAKAADRHRARMMGVVNAGIRAAQDAIPMEELEQILSVGHPGTGAALFVLADALQAMETSMLGTPLAGDSRVRAAASPSGLSRALLDTVAAGAKAVDLCVGER